MRLRRATRAALLAAALILLGGTPASADSGLVYVSGYTCDVAHGQPYCGSTADGVQVGPGVAACPAWVPFGTPITVHFPDGDASFVCHDRGPAHIDLWWPTIAECYARTGYYPVEVG